jgi:hypothetical protein
MSPTAALTTAPSIPDGLIGGVIHLRKIEENWGRGSPRDGLNQGRERSPPAVLLAPAGCLSPAERPRQGAARDRLSRTHPVHPRMDLRSGAQAPFQRRAQQGRGQKRARPRPVFHRHGEIRDPPSKTSATVPPASSHDRRHASPKAKLCPISCSPPLPRSAGSTSASINGDYVWPPEPLKEGFGRCEIRAPRFSMPLSVRFGTDSA